MKQSIIILRSDGTEVTGKSRRGVGYHGHLNDFDIAILEKIAQDESPLYVLDGENIQTYYRKES